MSQSADPEKTNAEAVSAGDASVAALRASAPYVRAHRGRTVVVHVPGEAALRANFPTLIEDLALVASLGIQLVLVLGARPQIRTALEAANLETRLVDGVRVTTPAALSEVKRVVGAHAIDIEARLSTSLAQTTLGGTSVATAAGNFVAAKPLGIVGGVDFEHTGEVRRIDTAGIKAALDGNRIVLIPAVGYSPSGEVFNVSTDDLAGFTAAELGADKLVMLHAGTPLAEREPSVGRQLSGREAEALIRSRDLSVETDDLSLLRQAAYACRHGVVRTHLISFDDPDALLCELYSRDGAGTLVAADGYDTIRNATPDDLTGILALIEPLAVAGVLVERSRETIELDLDYYRVMVRDGLITACAALVPYPEAHAAELACVAVHPDYRGNSRASELLAHAEREASTTGLTSLFALTTRAPHWFIEHGFQNASRADLPVQRQALYNDQRNSAVLIKALTG